jgi:carboxylate-amine ligase
VHVGVPNPDDAIRVLDVLRSSLPVLLALSANSPFSHGRETGFASWRTVIVQGFPRTGPPRRFESYRAYVEAVDALITSGALPDPTFLWWDVRLQPALGTVDVTPEVLDENRFLASRDGLRARLIDPSAGAQVPVRRVIRHLADRCRPHATALGCADQLQQLERLVASNGADRQRAAAARNGLPALVSALTEGFSTE